MTDSDDQQMEPWIVLKVVHHDDGATTVTMRNKLGNILVEDFPPGSTVFRAIREGEEP